MSLYQITLYNLYIHNMHKHFNKIKGKTLFGAAYEEKQSTQTSPYPSPVVKLTIGITIKTMKASATERASDANKRETGQIVTWYQA